MKWICFLFFLSITLFYVWSGKSSFNKKEWLFFFAKFILVFVATIITTLLVKFLVVNWHFTTVAVAKLALLKFFTSCIFFLGAKLGLVGLCTLFGKILGFHREYNPRYYPTLSTMSDKFSPKLVIVIKILISCGSALSFYGIWLAHS